MHDRMIIRRIDVALRPIGMPPAGTPHELPPLVPIQQTVHSQRRPEHQRARIDHMRQGAGIILGIGYDLGRGLVTGRLDEGLELPVRHRRAVDPEAINRHAMGRRFLRIVAVGSHAKGATGNPDHVAKSAISRLPIVLLGIGVQQRHVADTPAQIVPLNSPDGWLRSAEAAVGERIADPFRCCSRRVAEKSKQSAPLPYLCFASQAKSSASRSDVQFVPNEPQGLT